MKRVNMKKGSFAVFGICSGILLLVGADPQRPAAQDDSTNFRVNVVLVQLNVAVTDHKGNYIGSLRPEDFQVTEDNIPQHIATFEEGNETAVAVNHSTAANDTPSPAAVATKDSQPQPQPQSAEPASGTDANGIQSAHLVGANVFILFDTSNYMYRQFVFAQDAIADFVRSMDEASRIAFYSYSRNLSRSATLTTDRYRVVNGVRSTVAGDDAALYNSLLLTVEDAARLKGRKAIVVFSNGPDNASSVPPEDVAELAQSTGTIIYIISTRLAQAEPVSAAAFARMSKATGGRAYFAGNWRQEQQAFSSIREDLSHLYTLSYYPQANPNRGWRTIKVQLVGKDLQKYHIRTRDGYRLLPHIATSDDNDVASAPEQNNDADPK
jgi:Ca-activated chloride channel family protein